MITSFHGQHFFLSNFAPVDVVMEKITYPTVEHGYQAAKTLDIYERNRIRQAASPGTAKRIGRWVDMRPNWTQIKDQVMFDLLKQKFSNEVYLTHLLNTGSQYLIEGNTWGDKYWGAVYLDGKWIGQNKLGHLLMYIRNTYRVLPLAKPDLDARPIAVRQ